jgi:hypothetical protein
MILKPYASGLGDTGDDGGSGSTLTGILNSGAATGVVSGIFSLFGGKSSNTGSSHSSSIMTPPSGGTSPWVYIGGGVAAIGALALLMRKRRR